MKRKAEASQSDSNGSNKRSATDQSAIDKFRTGLFDAHIVDGYASEYAGSGPYKHAVIHKLMDDGLLRNVRNEIVNNIEFTPKETDIYKIHQSGDLANLDGLAASALDKLPSLLKLRDALYSYAFRQWVSEVSGAGALSGKKTDMAVNVYVPGCHLLCHDDVIGSRRVSYILYLTDPDKPWKEEWGGALRLYPTDEIKDQEGKTFKLPQSMWTKVIPPAWNQLSFFAVQPGESFHDVEEVYHRASGDGEDDGGRVRMAISGWFHIPQEGEEGFEPGLEEQLAEKSSLQQLQGKADEFDEPQHEWHDPSHGAQSSEGEDDELTEPELDHLIRFITPNYLTPETVEELNDLFSEESVLQLTDFLSPKFSTALRTALEHESHDAIALNTSRPPHKHRYQYLHASTVGPPDSDSPLKQLLNSLFPTQAFRKWLSLVTGLTLKRCSILARRFRQGLDYQLAQGYEREEPQLEFTLCITPSTGWAPDEDPSAEGGTTHSQTPATSTAEEDNPGGYELYMAGDEVDDEDEDDGASDHGVTIPASVQSQTGAGQRRSTKKTKKKKKKKNADPAVYQAAADDEDDGILYSNPAGWNTMSIVLRDKGTLKFVKYVSQNAPGARTDITGAWEVEDDGEDEEEEVE